MEQSKRPYLAMIAIAKRSMASKRRVTLQSGVITANLQVRDRARYPEPGYFAEQTVLPHQNNSPDINLFQENRSMNGHS